MRRVALRNSLKLDKLPYKLSLKGRIPLQGRLFNKGSLSKLCSETIVHTKLQTGAGPAQGCSKSLLQGEKNDESRVGV